MWFVACAACVAYGISLRVMYVGYPDSFSWDEHHFVNNARNYLNGAADRNDHPPLGKLFIALGMSAFGDSGLGWRSASLCLGIASIVLAYTIASAVFRDRVAGFVAAALLALDGFFIAYSRSALLDGMVATAFLATAAVLVRARKSWHVAVACVFAALAMSIKLSGITLVGAVVIVTLLLARAPRWSVVFVALVPVVYLAVYALGLALSGQESGLFAAIKATQKQVTHHLGLTAMKHPQVSEWYTWLIPTKPVIHRWTSLGEGQVRVTSAMGNPLLWWSASLALVYLTVRYANAAFAWITAKVMRKPRPVRPAPTAVRRNVALLYSFWWLPLTPWIFTGRDSYIYHYLPAYGFAIVLAAGAIAVVRRQRPLAALAALLILFEVSAFYGPIWSYRRMTAEAARTRLFMPGWQ